jgi:hypothetical protein
LRPSQYNRATVAYSFAPGKTATVAFSDFLMQHNYSKVFRLLNKRKLQWHIQSSQYHTATVAFSDL